MIINTSNYSVNELKSKLNKVGDISHCNNIMFI